MDLNLRSYAHTRVRHLLQRNRELEIHPDSSSLATVRPCTRSLVEPALPVDTSGAADILIRNARLGFGIAQRICDIAIQGRQIVALGTPGDMTGRIGDSTRIIEASGCSVLPGFSDSHIHLPVGAEQFQSGSAESVQTQDELGLFIRKYAEENRDAPVLYIFGLHYTEPPLIPAENARHFLDHLVPDKPLFLYAHDLHTGWANSCALHQAGLLHHMPPYPAIIQHLHLENNIIMDKEGFPSGELREPPVYFLVEAYLRRSYPATTEQKLKGLQKAFTYLAGLGLTSVHTMGLDLPEEDIELLMMLLELEEKNQLPLRVHSSFIPDENMYQDLRQAIAIRDHLHDARRQEASTSDLHHFLADSLAAASQGRRNSLHALLHSHPHIPRHPACDLFNTISEELHQVVSRLHVKPQLDRLPERLAECRGKHLPAFGKVTMNTVKIFMDGVVEKNTAFRLDRKPPAGIPSFSQEHLAEIVRMADRSGLQVAAHSIGDGSVHAMLNAIERAKTVNAGYDRQRGHAIRHRIEHIEMCRPEDIARFGKLGVIASMQPLHEREPTTLWHTLVPDSEWATAFAWRSLSTSGATLLFGSDWPIVSCSCLNGIEHAITRKIWESNLPDQSLSLQEATAAFTKHPAYAVYQEQVLGQIREGMLADLVILSDNIDDLQDKGFEKIPVRHTICNGEVTFG
jgi:predicted amidohydrolase YtcJ